MRKVLITGAGTGFGNEVAFRLAKKGFDGIAGVEIFPRSKFSRTRSKSVTSRSGSRSST